MNILGELHGTHFEDPWFRISENIRRSSLDFKSMSYYFFLGKKITFRIIKHGSTFSKFRNYINGQKIKSMLRSLT